MPGDGKPRLLIANEKLLTVPARAMFLHEINTTVPRTTRALFSIAVFHLTMGCVFAAIGSIGRTVSPARAHATIAVVLGLGTAYWALFIWSRRAALAAGIVGLAVYMGIFMLELIVFLTAIDPLPSSAPFVVQRVLGFVVGLLISLSFVILLLRGVLADLRIRQLLKDSG